MRENHWDSTPCVRWSRLRAVVIGSGDVGAVVFNRRVFSALIFSRSPVWAGDDTAASGSAM